MRTHRTLAAVSTAQLAVQVAGLAVTVRRRLRYDFVPLGWRAPGEPTVWGSALMGTPFSAPGAMIGAQLAATAVLHGRPSRTAARTVGVLGSAMVVGYLGERVVQQRLVDWDAVETPIAMAGLGGAVVMAWLGLGAAAR